MSTDDKITDKVSELADMLSEELKIESSDSKKKRNIIPEIDMDLGEDIELPKTKSDSPKSTSVSKLFDESVDLLSDTSKTSSLSTQSLKVKELGLNMMLLGLSEKAAHRINKLSSAIDVLEEELFDEETLENLPEVEKINRYRLALESLDRNIGYIKDTINNTSWEDIETKLLILEQTSVSDTDDDNDSEKVEEVALDLIKKLTSS